VKLFIRNIETSINEAQLEYLFAPFGEVVETKIIYDRITWESRGFGFVEMKEKNEAMKAMLELDGKEFRGKPLKIEEFADKRK
jgi:RNA recognition motif-containing protein